MSDSRNTDDLDLHTLINCPQAHNNTEKSAEANSTHMSDSNLDKIADCQYNSNDATYSTQTLNDNGNEDIDEKTEQKTNENMASMPSEVQKIHMPTQEKTIDMVKLKDAIRRTMALSEIEDKSLEKNEELQNEKSNKVRFSNIYKALPSQITNKMAKDLSAPLAFVALLHLATEENLMLEGTPKLNDIFISTDKK